jgi:hypothetical protein
MLFSLIHWQATDINTRKADSVYVLFCTFKMFKIIEHLAECKIRSVIHFLNARNVKPPDIHQICEVYSENAMSDKMMGKWIRKFNEGCDNMRDEPRSSRPSVMIMIMMMMIIIGVQFFQLLRLRYD